MKHGILAVVLLAAATVAHAGDTKRLIEGCKELVRIYDKQGQSGVLAGWSTSVSDALKAGYCRGVIDEFRRNNHCAGDSWHRQAMQIASAEAESVDGSTEHLLERSCGRD